MSPQTGDIWQYTFAKGRSIVTVLVMEKDDEWLDTWICLSLDNGECGGWYFGEAAMKDWKQLA
jgi:hypothetical protein